MRNPSGANVMRLCDNMKSTPLRCLTNNAKRAQNKDVEASPVCLGELAK